MKHHIRYSVLIIIAFTLVQCGKNDSSQVLPNILLIMGDDIGYSDLGAYGSEIKTPNLDLLATDGIQFQTFYNMAKM